jgi:hypothetical protein
MVIQLHEDQRGQVRLNSNLSETFSIINSVKQGCVLAPTPFSMMLKQVTKDLMCYCLDGSLFNLGQLQTQK